MSSQTCYIGLGANIANELGTPNEHIANAIHAFKTSVHFDNIQVSSLYLSKAFGVTDQPDFINAVLRANTSLTAVALLDFCQTLEQHAKRERRRHWGERSLDVDILTYGDQMINSQRLIVPHSGLFERNFVVMPMLEIDPDVAVGGQKLANCPAANDFQTIKRISAT